MADAHKAVFLSYASQDAEAARRICETLRAGGVEVWFDADGGLEHGDEWDAKIRRQIKECVLFIPIISANTQARHEGYFRIEWELAARRAMGIASGVPFILPVLIDDTREPEALVPDGFRTVQWTRLRNGELPPEVRTRFLKLWSHRTGFLSHQGTASAPQPSESGAAAPGSEGRVLPRRGRRGLMIGVVAIVLLSALGWRFLSRDRHSDQPEAGTRRGTSVAVEKPRAPLSETRKLVAQARTFFEEGDYGNHEDFFLAEDLLKRALALDDTDGEVWAAQAQLSREMAMLGYDRNTARSEAMRRQAERAVKLAPNSVEAQIAYAGYLQMTGPSTATEAVRLAEQLSARIPDNRRIFRVLGMAWSQLDNLEKSVAAFDRAHALPGGDATALGMKASQLIWYGRYEEAETAVAQAQALRATGRGQVLDVMLKLSWRGDLDGAAAALERWPAWLRLEDRGAFFASQVWMWRRQPDKAVDVLNAVARDAFNDTYFTGPKASLLALAHEMAGRPEAARAEWENAKRVATRLVAEDPTLKRALALKACALARLGETAEAGALLRGLEQTRDLRAEFWSSAAPAALLRLALDRKADVVTKFESEPPANLKTTILSPRAALVLNPVFDSLRSDAAFQRLIANAPAPKLRSPIASGGVIDPKSVAVLAFTNLSDDKDNEYFSDGISEELINVLGRVPGLTVKGRTSSFFFKGRQVPSAEIAQQLGVAYIVRGSVRKAGNIVRITAELSRAATDELVWSSPPFDRELKDVFAVQEEIAALVAKNLSLKLGAGAATRRAFDAEAYRLYLEGRQAWRLRNRAGFALAEDLFRKALAIDPAFAPALVGLADVRDSSMPDELAEAAALVERALESEPDLAEAYATMGLLREAQWDFAGAEKMLRKAISLNPNHASSHQWLGRYLERQGKLEVALAELKHAVDLDPLAPRILDNYASALLWRGQDRLALEWAERAAAVHPNSVNAHRYRAEALWRLGRGDESLVECRWVLKNAALEAGPSMRMASVLFILRRAGLQAEAEQAVNSFPDPKERDRLWLSLPIGRFDAALNRLEDLVVDDLSVVYWSEMFDPVRTDPRFGAYLRKHRIEEIHRRAQDLRRNFPKESTR